MPTIKRKMITRAGIPRTKNDGSFSQQRRRTVYGNTTWVALRNLYLEKHPLCYDCEMEGKINPATDVHHIIALNDPGSRGLEYDEDNLLSLCSYHHGLLHAQHRETAYHHIVEERKKEKEENE